MRIAMLALTTALCAAIAMADTIIVDGVTYRDVDVKESGSRYYFFTPDGEAMSVSKDAIGPNEIAFGDAPLAGAAADVEIAAPEEVMPTVVSTADAVTLPPAAPIKAGAASANLLRGGRGGLEANALVLASGDNTLGIVSLDLAAIDRRIVEGIIERLGSSDAPLTAENCIIAATGRYTEAQTGILEGPLEEIFFGDYVPEAANQIVAAAVEALTGAVEAQAPAVLRVAETQLPAVHSSTGADGAALDSTLNAFQVNRPDGAAVAYLVSFPLYPAFGPTAAPQEGRGAVGATDSVLSEVAGEEIPVVFLNGPAADTEPDLSRGEEAIGEEIATAALDALGGTEPVTELPLLSVSRSTGLPPTLLAGLVPEVALLIEAHIGDTVIMTAPASVSAQPGVLLRVKAVRSGKEHVILASHANGFVGLVPSIDGFFLGGVTEQSSFYGPLAGKWLAETYLPGLELDPPLWHNLPELHAHAGAFTNAREAAAAEAETIRARYEAVSEGFGRLTQFVRNAPAMLGDKAPPELTQIMPLIEGLEDAELQAFVKQLAATLFRSQAGEFTAEQRARLMGAAEGAGIPFDATVLLQALSDATALPQEAQIFIQMAKGQGGSMEGYNFL